MSMYGISGQGRGSNFRSSFSAPRSTQAARNISHTETAQQQAQLEQNRRSAEEDRKAILARIEADVQRALKQLENITPPMNYKLKYSVNFGSSDVMVKIIDPATNKVIKELPAIGLRRFRERFQELIGLFIDTKV